MAPSDSARTPTDASTMTTRSASKRASMVAARAVKSVFMCEAAATLERHGQARPLRAVAELYDRPQHRAALTRRGAHRQTGDECARRPHGDDGFPRRQVWLAIALPERVGGGHERIQSQLALCFSHNHRGALEPPVLGRSCSAKRTCSWNCGLRAARSRCPRLKARATGSRVLTLRLARAPQWAPSICSCRAAPF